jgi:uncharacterized membrane protein
MIKPYRITSIDLLRGIVMIFMALDHIRDYFHADAFLYDPTDLTKTNVVLFFTRFITHYCAPVFVFLAGVSAFLVGTRKSKKELSVFLLTRGLWLVFLELIIINFGWFFNIQFPFIPLIVVWAIGIGMITLAGFLHLPFNIILACGLLIVFGHNALDGVHVTGGGIDAIVWSIIHEPGFFPVGERSLFVGYPVLPWIGVMLLGYCFGSFYKPGFDRVKREKILLYLGSGAILLFVIIRYINVYGDASHWSTQPTAVFTFLSFLNVSKYPPSLLYVLVTLGPAMLFLSFAEKIKGAVADAISVFGRVPMFYYLLHIYFIHVLAILAAVLTGYDASTMIFTRWINSSPELSGYGFNLGIVYLIWIGLVLALYPLCTWYDTYKINNKHKVWPSYL